jgi:hypothetical protein
MIVNTKYKFIFVHIPKSAGNSVMSALSTIEGNNTNWLAKTKHETLSEFEANYWKRKSLGDWLAGRSARGFFSFCFVRNPWDRMASFYRYLCEKRPRKEIDQVRDFGDFLRMVDDAVPWVKGLHTIRPQTDYFLNTGESFRIGFVGHMEHLHEDLASVSKVIGHELSIPRLNRSSNSKRDYRSEYNDTMVDIIARKFKEDIDLFGYEFDEPQPINRISSATQ